MIQKKDICNAFVLAGSLNPARDRIVLLYLKTVDKTAIEGKTDDQIAVDAIVWYVNEVVTDDMISYLKQNLTFYPVVEFLQASLDEYTIFQMLVGLNNPNAKRRVWKGDLVPALAGTRLVYLGSVPFDTKGDIFIGLHGKTTGYKYSYGEYRTYLTEEGKVVVTKETVVQDMEDDKNHLIIRSVIPYCNSYITAGALDNLVDEKYRGLYDK